MTGAGASHLDGGPHLAGAPARIAATPRTHADWLKLAFWCAAQGEQILTAREWQFVSNVADTVAAEQPTEAQRRWLLMIRGKIARRREQTP